MKVRIIKRKTIEDFSAENARCRTAFRIWLTVLKHADWNTPSDIIETFGSADILGKGCNRVVFDIAGNHFRMICGYYFGNSIVHIYVKWIGTHAEYTLLCNKNEQFSVNKY